MVFPSVHVYLDHPDWQQTHTLQHAGVITSERHRNSQLPPPTPQAAGVGGAGGIKPGSMAERARLAKIPQPESAMKCPRCESMNTKFCYFNNYSLSQPRHFCKTCRRYWNRGGALRNVPVGGGWRRNKRSNGSNKSKSPSVVSERQTGSTSSSGTLVSNGCTDILGHMNLAALQLPLFPPLHHLEHYSSGGIQPQVTATGGGTSGTDMDLQGSTCGGSILTNRLVEQHQNGLYPFESVGVKPPPSHGSHHPLRSKPSENAVTQLEAVKMEDAQALDLSRNFLEISGVDHQYWCGSVGNSWTDHSG